MSGNDSRGELSAAQKRAIAALLTERDIKSAAVAAKVGEATLFRWMRDDDFVAELHRAENDVLDRIVRRVLQVQEAALAVVVSILADKHASDNTRLRAAALVLDNFVKLRELRNTESRLTELEQTVIEIGGKL